tara:strand:+ start:12108 stop:12503 length:396 start_codon:yes stop_codon:yes gene_type:complete
VQQFFIAIIAILGIACWWLYSENQTLTMNNMQLEVAIQQQEEAIATIKESYEKQGQALNQLSSRNAQIEAEMNGYLDIFRRHNLNKLAIAKPGLIEKDANDATSAVFRSIENDSKELDSLDDPSSDINPNN